MVVRPAPLLILGVCTCARRTRLGIEGSSVTLQLLHTVHVRSLASGVGPAIRRATLVPHRQQLLLFTDDGLQLLNLGTLLVEKVRPSSSCSRTFPLSPTQTPVPCVGHDCQSYSSALDLGRTTSSWQPGFRGCLLPGGLLALSGRCARARDVRDGVRVRWCVMIYW